jgi:tripartite-type tricarboxylate transporter receptor subunit TctC
MVMLLKLFASAALALALAGPAASVAQTYPAKTVRIIIGLPPGGTPDMLARGVAQELTKLWGQPVIVENRVSVGDIVAATAVAKSAPDGYTILLSPSTTMNTAQFLRRNLPYDPARDFLPVVGLAQTQAYLVASNKLPANSLQELVALARARPGALNYGSWGIGSAAHLDAEALARAAGVRFTHIPYKGAAAFMNALVAGEIDFVFGSPTTVPLVKQGRVKALAYTGRERSKLLPDVPTLAETGYDFESVGMFTLYVPAGTGSAVVDKIAGDVSQARATPAFQKIIAQNGMEDFPLQGSALIARLQQSRERFAERIKGLDIKLD